MKFLLSVHWAGKVKLLDTALAVAKLFGVHRSTLWRLLRRFDAAPMIQPILFKTTFYWAVVFLMRFLEKLVEYLFAGGSFGGIPKHVMTHFTWHRFAAVQIWIFVLFLVYTSIVELNEVLGHGELGKIFFTRRSSKTKLTPPVADSRLSS